MEKYLVEKSSAMGIKMSAEQAGKLHAYHEMLINANSAFNLTSVQDDISEACDRNYLDSLALLPYLGDARTLVDVGSGAGLPGIPLAIMRGDVHIVLMDALKKRVGFMQSVIDALSLNACAVHIRSEAAARLPEYRDSFDIACARAVADMTVLTEWLLPFVKPGGRMLALKGPGAQAGTEAASYAICTRGGRVKGIYDVNLPGRDWQHKIVEIEKLTPTPERFPRREGMAEKRPLKS